jgi:hypothetical protein
MAPQATFASFIKKERARLDKARKDALANKAAVDKEIESIERELTALDAYQQAKGTPARRAPGKRGPAKRGPAKARRTTGRRGEKRQAVLDLIQKNPVGLSRGEILIQLGVKGNRSAEQSVSNALSALKKSEKVNSREGKYVPA